MVGIVPILSGLSGFIGASRQAAQQKKQNELLEQQYEWQKSKEVPGVAGAQQALSAGYYANPNNPGQFLTQEQYDALDDTAKTGYQYQSQFQPFLNQAGQTAVAGGNIAQQYLSNVPFYQQAGLQGLQGLQGIKSWSPQQQQELADTYSQQYGTGAYNLARDDINWEAQQNRNKIAREQGRFGALSSQKARADALIEQGRTKSLLEAAERAKQVGYDRAQAEIARQTNLSQNLLSAGTSGLAQAQQASTLGAGSADLGIQTPFKPFQQYGTTVSQQPTASVPQFGQVVDPFSTGIGLGLQAWGATQNQGGQ